MQDISVRNRKKTNNLNQSVEIMDKTASVSNNATCILLVEDSENDADYCLNTVLFWK